MQRFVVRERGTRNELRDRLRNQRIEEHTQLVKVCAQRMVPFIKPSLLRSERGGSFRNRRGGFGQLLSVQLFVAVPL